jgi:predicted enzyme related to lactoylglutathione lyase
MLKKVAFTMYPVENIDRAMGFYKENLGLIPSSIADEGAWVEYDLPAGGCFAITTLAQGVRPSAHAGGSIAFEVENLDALVAKLKLNNIQFKLDIFSTPVCRLAVMLDSEGNSVILHELKNKK